MAPEVLFVEDDPDIRNVFSIILTKAGYKITQAAHGAEGLAFATQKHFDLVITDFIMPVMDGNLFIKELAKLPNPPPVLVLTAAFDTVEANPIIVKNLMKPVSVKEFIHQVATILN